MMALKSNGRESKELNHTHFDKLEKKRRSWTNKVNFFFRKEELVKINSVNIVVD